MEVRQVLGAIVAMIARVVIAVAIIVVVFRIAVQSYDFGFRIFAEEPVSEGEGRTVSVAVLEGKSTMEIGEMLQEKGLINDAKLFYVQEKLSNYKDSIQPGVYELKTSMTAEEMLAVMAGGEEQSTEEE